MKKSLVNNTFVRLIQQKDVFQSQKLTKSFYAYLCLAGVVVVAQALRMSFDGVAARLEVRQVDVEDAGQYSCRVRSAAGSAATAARLLVTGTVAGWSAPPVSSAWDIDQGEIVCKIEVPTHARFCCQMLLQYGHWSRGKIGKIEEPSKVPHFRSLPFLLCLAA